jgi:2,4-dienoyl-CoA reductase-like NADH-dependent reductase (Old Yellow Enzyme family)
MSILSSPLVLRSGAVLPNRIAKAAMSEVLADPDSGAPTEALIRLYDRWARSGAGLLITGHVIVDPNGRAEPNNVLALPKNRAALQRWAEAAQRHGASAWMQLNHAGRQSLRQMTRDPVAPSAVPMKRFAGMFGKPRALREEEIVAIIGRFADAAALAQATGFGGVELHAAHGYLVSQFLSPRTNLRADAWGGDPARRSRFLLEIVRAVRAAVGPAFPVGVKLNSADFQRGGFTIDEAMNVARALGEAGVDLLEVSGGSYESPAMSGSGELPAEQRASSREREAYFLDYAKRIRSVTAMPILLTGGMRSREVMEQALASGAIDAVGIARPLTYAPELPRQLLDGSVNAAPVVRIRSRVRAIDDALQAVWFQAQMERMSRGLDPDPKLGKLGVLWRALAPSLNPFVRSRPTLPAPEPT